MVKSIKDLAPQAVRNFYHLVVACIASVVYGFPSRKMKTIGVTGTDGKTTTTNLIYWILRSSNKKVGIVSTVNAIIVGKKQDTGFHVTNPDPFLLQRLLKEMAEEKCEFAVLEVTSHGLDQKRVVGINFEISALTNITHEHLDYHKTYENYVKAKVKLFNNSKTAVINKDDESYKYVSRLINKEVGIVPYSRKTLEGVVRKTVFNKFKEPYNQQNATAAIVVTRRLGITDEQILKAIRSFKGVEGRMQEVKNKKGMKIYVDFAHTPNALESVLTTLRERKHKGNKLIVVFGCAGERDVEKRAMMGEISTRIADISIFTAEDPRFENVDKIIDMIAKGANRNSAKEGVDYFRISERGEAISYAISRLAKKGDVVVICGKGHEKSMAYNGIEYPWSDRLAVDLALKGKVKTIDRN